MVGRQVCILQCIPKEREDLPGVFCEIFVTKKQFTEPKISSRRLEDGSMVSAPLEDMYPFLPREELAQNMYIELDESSRKA